ncbi:Threonyl-tRNA synthetase editing domain-containing protein [Desulfovibrio sp. X2]|uniref:threonyl-tRNA synthetase editing domain-containing protein n=1 Tax=Desulfovibrio sp. X2 TaxID=941449 RepID=UPI000358D289|nr:threonyl-tRNA synthetase editing domain-containing protein [Desulfovibrio sp. X2]EPR44661.1 Threonyl-tRNA synthetase editing domain-containing protein [Desulfovibrio sp. X2]
MKLLMFYGPEFWSKPFRKTLPEAGEAPGELSVSAAAVVFYQCEEHDAGRKAAVLQKTLKNIKWLAGKFSTRRVVLHSFGHLSASKADPGFARGLMDEVRARLESVDYEVHETPFGWLNEWRMHVSGESLAKVFKDI